ncbi:MAG: dynamin family protein [Treponema sp.]
MSVLAKKFKKASDALAAIETEFKDLLDILNRKYDRQSDTISKEIEKFSDTVTDEIPIVIMGTYSSGKSAFINALIGLEVLPSATTTTTAKTHRIRKSTSSKIGKITFKYDEEPVQLLFEETSLKVEPKPDNDFCNNLYCSIMENSKDNSIESHLYQALKHLNEQDRKDREKFHISHLSDLIELEVPSKNGIFSEKKYNFSVLDTPGSDSADKGTDKSHFQILKNALKNQTNGLPIFVTIPDGMNSAGNKEILDEMKTINLDKNNMIIIANKAEQSSDEGLKKLVTENDVIREWQSTRIYFVSSIAGLAGQKKGDISFDIPFYNEEYSRPFRKSERDFTEKDNNPDYRELYAFNIMPDSQKERIAQKCQKDVETGDKKRMLFANSGIQCVVEEVFSYGEKHALYNKCANAKKYLVNAINIVRDEIKSKKNELKAPAEEISKKLDEKKRNLISQLRSTSNELSERAIAQYPANLSSKKDDELDQKKRKIGKDWIKTYENKYESELKNRGVDSFSSIRRIGKKFSVFPDEYGSANDFINDSVDNVKNKNLKIAAGFGKTILNTTKKSMEAAGKTIVNVVSESVDVVSDFYDAKKDVRGMVKKEVEKSLLKDVKDIDRELYSESRIFFKEKERDLKDALIAVAMNKEADELTKAEKEKIKDVIEKFPTPEETGDDAEVLQESHIARYLFGKFIDLGDINYPKLAEESKKKLEEIVSDQTLVIQKGFDDSFLIWCESLISSIEKEITSLNPDLMDWSKEKLRLENDLRALESIESKISDSEKMLDIILSAQEIKNGKLN